MPGACPCPDHNPVSPSKGRERPRLDLPVCKYGSSQGKSLNGVCSPAWCGDIWHSKAPQQLLPCTGGQHHSVSLSSAWLHFLISEINSSSTVGHCWEDKRKNLADLRLWQGIVQAQACRKPLPRAAVWEEIITSSWGNDCVGHGLAPNSVKTRHRFAKPAILAASLTKTSKHNVSVKLPTSSCHPSWPELHYWTSRFFCRLALQEPGAWFREISVSSPSLKLLKDFLP